MSFNDFFDFKDENGVSNREKIALRQKIIRRTAETDKEKSYETADGKSNGVVTKDGKVIGFGIHIFNEDIYPLQSFEIYLRNCDLAGKLNLSMCPDILFVDIYHNRVESINVTGLKELRILGLQDNRISSLDVRSLANVVGIDAGKNNLAEIDVSKNTEIVELYVNDNHLSSIDTSCNPKLKYFYCHNNRIETLDMTSNPLLRHLNATGNPLRRIQCFAPQQSEPLPLELTAAEGGTVGLRFNPIYNAQWKETGKWEQVYYADACDGYSFIGWEDQDGKVLSHNQIWTDQYGKSRILTARFKKR